MESLGFGEQINSLENCSKEELIKIANSSSPENGEAAFRLVDIILDENSEFFWSSDGFSKEGFDEYLSKMRSNNENNHYEWCKYAADLGNRNAIIRLGAICQLESLGESYENIEKMKIRAAETGDIDSMVSLAQFYENYLEDLDRTDYDKAYYWYKKAIDAGCDKDYVLERYEFIKKIYDENHTSSNKKHCYVATAVYGSYDCPQVWRFRRYRDEALSKNIFGRLFIKIYYAVSPTVIKYFGKTKCFNSFFRKHLDKFYLKLAEKGYDDTPYQDI